MTPTTIDWLGYLGLELYVPDYYAIYMVLIVVSIALSLVLAKERNLPLLRFYFATVGILICALIGGKIYALFRDLGPRITEWSWDGVFASGMGSSGVYIGGIIAALAILKWMRIDILAALDVYAPPAALALILGRVGCFLAGCCHGTVCDAPWCVRYPVASHAYRAQLDAGLIANDATASLPVHPTQLYEALFGALAFFVLMTIRKKIPAQGELFFGYFAGYGLFRFFVEFIRGDHRPMLWLLNIPQLVFGVIFLCCFTGLAYQLATRASRTRARTP